MTSPKRNKKPILVCVGTSRVSVTIRLKIISVALSKVWFSSLFIYFFPPQILRLELGSIKSVILVEMEKGQVEWDNYR